jgi:hypothetical protein
MWVNPLHGLVKVNVDASFSAERLAGGTGAVIQDECGHFIAAAT